MRRWIDWVLHNKTPIAIILGLIVLIVAGIWFWGVLVGYVQPGTEGATDRKDVIQAFALIAAGIIGLIGGIVGIANLSVSRRNLRQQIELEEQRSETTHRLEQKRSETTRQIEQERRQDAALQAYFEQMGDLLTDHSLITSERNEVRLLARAQTLTVLGSLNSARKGAIVRFLHGAQLITGSDPIVLLRGADLHKVSLYSANLPDVNLSQAVLINANIRGVNLTGAKLRNTDLRNAELINADLSGANLSGANLSDAKVTEEQLAACGSLSGATMPNGQKYEKYEKMRRLGLS